MIIRIEKECVNRQTGKREKVVAENVLDDTMMRLVRDPFTHAMDEFEKALREVFVRCDIDVPPPPGA